MSENGNEIAMIEARLAAVEAQVQAQEQQAGAGEGDPNYASSLLAGDDFIKTYGRGGGGMFKWDAKKKQIGAGGVMVGRTWIAIAASAENLEDGTYCVEVTLGSSADTAQIVKGSVTAPTATTCRIPIYTVADGKMTGDMRWAFVVQCWE